MDSEKLRFSGFYPCLICMIGRASKCFELVPLRNYMGWVNLGYVDSSRPLTLRQTLCLSSCQTPRSRVHESYPVEISTILARLDWTQLLTAWTLAKHVIYGCGKTISLNGNIERNSLFALWGSLSPSSVSFLLMNWCYWVPLVPYCKDHCAI